MRVLISCVMIVIAMFSARGQSPAELKVKYGPAMEAYEIRPHILMTVRYAQDNQVYEYVIEARHNSGERNSAESLMSLKLVNELIDELAPTSQRGAHQRSLSFNSSCNGIGVDTYERVEIRTVSTCPSTLGNQISSVIIRWRNRSLKE